MSILKLIPACKSYIWGGNRLKNEYGKISKDDIIAETWELSCHPDGKSIIANGQYKGISLDEYIKKEGKKVLGTNCNRFEDLPILIKLIDAKENLSVQVHPNDEYALAHEGQNGKTEMWYIIDCEEGSFIYYGFKKNITKEELEDKIKKNKILDILNKVYVKKGDSFLIEAGTVHAIGGGILIAEIQKSSNVTYRIYDYGRKDKNGKERELHIQKGLDVIDTSLPKKYDFNDHLCVSDFFQVDKICVKDRSLEYADERSFNSLLILEGNGEIKSTKEQIAFAKGDSIFIPAGIGNYEIIGDCEIIMTTIPDEKKKYRIGIDIGGTNVKIGIVDKNNEIIEKRSIKTEVKLGWKAIIADIAKGVNDLLKESKIAIEQCISVGIDCPGTVDFKDGSIVYANNLEWENVPLAQEFKKHINLPIKVANDANAAALGEVINGGAKGYKNVVMVTLGTGVGGGVIIDGKLFEGGGPGGTELGHISLVVGGEKCTCGRNGCFEAYASATALIREAKKAAISDPKSKMNVLCKGDINKMTGSIPFSAAQEGDKTAQKVIDNYIMYLGEGIVDLINIFRPDKVLLSGGVCNQGENLTVPLNKYIRKYTYAGTRVPIPEVIRATLGNDAGIIGAANL